MKFQILSTAALFGASAIAAPCPGGDCQEKKVYPAGTGENLPIYPAPAGGWESVDYSGGNRKGDKCGIKTMVCPVCPEAPAPVECPVAPVPVECPAAPAPVDCPAAPAPVDCPAAPAAQDPVFSFTSTWNIIATPDQVVNGTTPTGGLAGALGYYNFGLNSNENTICFNITLVNFQGEYQSLAATATHIHEAARGASGPPRIALPNPIPINDNMRRSIGCLVGPFSTGAIVNGTDTGAAFDVAQIEANPAGFFADVHSSLAVPGAVRGQFA